MKKKMVVAEESREMKEMKDVTALLHTKGCLLKPSNRGKRRTARSVRFDRL